MRETVMNTQEDGYISRICWMIAILRDIPEFSTNQNAYVYSSFQDVMIANLHKAGCWDEISQNLDETALCGMHTMPEITFSRILLMALNLRKIPLISRKERCEFFDSMEKAITRNYYAINMGWYLELAVDQVQPKREKYFVKVGRWYYNEADYKDNGLIVKRNRFKYVDEMKRKREIEKITLGEKS